MLAGLPAALRHCRRAEVVVVAVVAVAAHPVSPTVALCLRAVAAEEDQGRFQ